MTDDICPREAEVLRACESGTWPTDLADHVSRCDACREVQAVARVLREAVDAEDAAQLPTAHDIWWRAQWQARQEARARAMRPLDRMERAEPLVALVAVVALLVLRGDVLLSQLTGWATSNSTGQVLQAVMPPALLPVLLVGAGLGALVFLVGIGAVLAND
jgi:hypothetical protein